MNVTETFFNVFKKFSDVYYYYICEFDTCSLVVHIFHEK